MNKDWTEPSRIEEKVDYMNHGVYKILLYKNEEPAKINRFYGTDLEGILSIGKSVNIDKRRDLFYKTSQGRRKKGHSEARTLFIIIKQIENIFDQYSLMFSFKRTKQGNELTEERKEIKEYFKKFLELPPLNHQFPDRMKWYDKLR